MNYPLWFLGDLLSGTAVVVEAAGATGSVARAGAVGAAAELPIHPLKD